jgi:hypothetical protein
MGSGAPSRLLLVAWAGLLRILGGFSGSRVPRGTDGTAPVRSTGLRVGTCHSCRRRVIRAQDLVAAVDTWLDCYLDQDTEPRLRHVLTEVESLPPQVMSAAEVPPGSLPVAVQYRHRRSH